MSKRLFSLVTRHCIKQGCGAGVVKFKVLTILGLRFYLYEGYRVDFTWAEGFKKYFNSNDMKAKVKNLKQSMDRISCQYIDLFMLLSKFWGRYFRGSYWSSYDKKLLKKYKSSNFEQPFPEIKLFDKLTFFNNYGLGDLPEYVFSYINGKDIIDAGGFDGDTALIFKNLFPDSKIFVYEPLAGNMNVINKIAREINSSGTMKIIPVCKGLGNKQEKINLTFHYTEECEITTLEKDYSGNNLGLIKMDTEGFESKIVDGAANLIKKYKPVIVAAIYHTPEDFFELKDKLQMLNPDYKFMIRRSEFIIPTADFILIAF